MRFGSVCSGIEAASCAWEPLGWKAAWFSEISAFPSKVLAHHYPETPNHGSLVGLADRLAGDARSIDLLVGGTPCQSFSIAGLRGGLADGRGNLALEFMRLAQALRPRWVLWENVPGVLSSGGGRDFGAILGALVELGYGFSYRVLDAQHFGVAQRRRRVFLVGCLGSAAAAASVLFEPESLRRHLAPSREAREDVAGTLGGGSGGRGWASDTERMTFVPEAQRWPKDVAPTLNAAFGSKQGLEDQHALGGAGLFVPDIVGTMTSAGPAKMGAPEVDGGYYISSVVSCEATDRAHLDALWAESDGRLDGEVMGLNWNAATVATVANGSPTLVKRQESAALVGHRVRRLTPMECERLQGFPDGYTAIPGAKDGPRYAALGNSMAVPVMRWIGQRIARVDAILGAYP